MRCETSLEKVFMWRPVRTSDRRVKLVFFLKKVLTGSRCWKGPSRGPEGGVKEPSGGWRWALPESRPSPGRCRKSPDICPIGPPPAGWDQRGGEGGFIYRNICKTLNKIIPRAAETSGSFRFRTLSFRKPILRMFSTLAAPSAMLRSPSESPIRMMLLQSFSRLKYSVFRRAPSCLLYTWIISPLKPFRTPFGETRSGYSRHVLLTGVKPVTAPPPQQGLTLSSKSMKLETTLMLGW